MHKVINETKISFFDNSGNEIMYIDYPTDECIWYFRSSEEIEVTEDEELYEPLKNIFLQQYQFKENDVLKSYKSDNELVWYSDCYYNPDNELSKKSVSYLKILLIDKTFKLKCIKPLDAIIDRKDKSHVICFSPLGNGKYIKNIKSGLTLQDDFVLMVYQKLLKRDNIKRLHK